MALIQQGSKVEVHTLTLPVPPVDDREGVIGFDVDAGYTAFVWDGAAWVPIGGATPTLPVYGGFEMATGEAIIASGPLAVGGTFVPTGILATGLTNNTAGITVTPANQEVTILAGNPGEYLWEWGAAIRVPRSQVPVYVEAELEMFIGGPQNRAMTNVTLNAAEGWKAVSGRMVFEPIADAFGLPLNLTFGVTHRASDLAGYGGTIVFEFKNIYSQVVRLGDE